MTPELRLAARAIVLDLEDRVLLVRFEHQGAAWWAMPGGGLEAGETHEQALRRELVEEVGIHDAPLGPCAWVREHTFPWLERVIQQRERYHVVRLASAPASPALTDEQLRAEGIAQRRWWTLDELLASRETFAPRGLAAALRALLESGPPAEPLDVGV